LSAENDEVECASLGGADDLFGRVKTLPGPRLRGSPLG
jgi:hypothetical protein